LLTQLYRYWKCYCNPVTDRVISTDQQIELPKVCVLQKTENLTVVWSRCWPLV